MYISRSDTLNLELLLALAQIRHKAVVAFGFERFASVTPEEYHRLVKAVQVGFELFGQLCFALERGGGVAESQAVRDAVHMRIDRHQVGAGVLYHDDIGGLLPDACEFDQLFLLKRNFAAVVFDDALRHLDKVFGFVVKERTAFDKCFELFEIGVCQSRGRRVLFKKRGGDDVDAFVGTLRREHHRYQEFVEVAIVQFGNRVGVVR